MTIQAKKKTTTDTLNIHKTIWLPHTYSSKPITSKDDRQTMQYHKGGHVGKRKRNPNMTPYSVIVDAALVDSDIQHHLRMAWNKVLHLIPYYSFTPSSMQNVLMEFKREIVRMESKHQEIKPVGWKPSKVPMNAVIEFGDKLHGIHAHLLIKTFLPKGLLDEAWFKANKYGDVNKKIKLLKERMTRKIRVGYVEELKLELAEDKWKAIQYCITYETLYSQIDADKGTSYVTDLIVKYYTKEYW